MLPMINGKQIIDCNLEDLQIIIDNSDYRENEYIDYKAMFSVDQYSKGDTKQEEKIAEFRSDICALANASGGYLFLGIAEEKGVPQYLCGIDIKDDNPDKFELRLKNYLQKIEPRIPNCKFRFIPLENGKHIVIILVLHDAFAPYLHLEDEKNYRAYKRVGNGKMPIAYTELKRMFVQSVALEKEIEKFRKERIEYFRSVGRQRFFLFQIIPDTFVDTSYNRLAYALDKQNRGELSGIFTMFECMSRTFPTVDGLIMSQHHAHHEHICQIFNNLSVEAFDSLRGEIHKCNSGETEYFYFPWSYIFDKVEELLRAYFAKVGRHLSTMRVFACMSILDCNGLVTEMDFCRSTMSSIDRNELLIAPCVFEDILNQDTIELSMKQLKLSFLLALGITANDELKILLKEFEQ